MKKTLTIISATLLSGTVFAETAAIRLHKGTYLGFGLGRGETTTTESSDISFKDSSAEFFAGYRFSDRLAAEARFRTLGEYETEDGTQNSISALGADALLYLPPIRYNPKNGARIDTYIRAGVAQTNRRVNDKPTVSPVDLTGGFGAELTVPGGYGVRGELSSLGLENPNASLGIIWHLDAANPPKASNLYNPELYPSATPSSADLLDQSDYPDRQRLNTQKMVSVKQGLPRLGTPTAQTSKLPAPAVAPAAPQMTAPVQPLPPVTPLPAPTLESNHQATNVYTAPPVPAVMPSNTGAQDQGYFPLPDYGPIEVQATARNGSDFDYDGVSDSVDHCPQSIAKLVNQRGCAYEGRLSRIQFSGGRLTSDAEQVMRAIARELAAEPGRAVRVTVAAADEQTSYVRGQAIKSTLRGLGIPDPLININTLTRQNDRVGFVTVEYL